MGKRQGNEDPAARCSDEGVRGLRKGRQVLLLATSSLTQLYKKDIYLWEQGFSWVGLSRIIIQYSGFHDIMH